MSRTATISLLKSQEDFFFSDALHTAYVGGFGSGKSYVGVLKTIIKKRQYPHYPVAYYLPTYPLIKDIAFPKFTEILNELEIPHTLNKSDKEILIPGMNKIIMRTMDEPSRIIGYEVCYSLIDEADVLPMEKMTEAFGKILARNRAVLDGAINSTDIVSTPEGYRWLYNFFVKGAKPGRVLIKAKTSENPFLPKGYIDGLKESYSPAQLAAYLNGEFVNLTSGSVYTDFDRKDNHSGRMLHANDVIHVGIDFNITNMSATINVIDNNVAYCVEELTRVYDTFSMIELIKKRYPGHKMVVYPDASGSNRKTSGKSDKDLLVEAGFSLRKPRKNPFVKDRINAMNKRFRDKTYYINTFNCPELTEAIEKQAYDKNGEPDKTTGFDHLCDAAGYFINMISKVSF